MGKDFETKELNCSKNNLPPKVYLIFGILTIMLLGFAIKIYTLSNQIIISTAKKDIEISQLKNTVKEKSKNSEIEIFGGLADASKKQSERLLLDIEKTYKKAKNLEGEYETALLRKKCYKDQIDRMVEGKDYSEKFCEETQNLETYRKK